MLVETADVDNDGRVSLEDFRKMLKFEKGAADGSLAQPSETTESS